MAQSIVNENQAISYTNLDFSAIYTETMDMIKQLTYKWDPSISDESDPGVVLVKLSALLADKLNYNIDKNVLETFPLSVTQNGNARQLYDQLGYYMDWYQSGQTAVTLSWKLKEGEEASSTPVTYKIPKFTPICDTEQTSGKRFTLVGVEGVEKEVVSDIFISTDGIAVTALAMEGFPVQYQFEGESVITSQMVDPNSRRLYFTTKYISQNGVFIKNTGQENYAEWNRVNNLYENSYFDLRYMFGYDSLTDTCFLEFPDNYAELFGSGIEITYLIIDPTAGDVIAGELSQLLTPVTVKSVTDATTQTTTEITLNNENLSITNYLASSGHTDVEGLNEAYENYKKTVGTFKTLITLRDYLNYIRNEDLDICSNAFVCDRTNDVQTVYKIMSRQHDLQNLIVKVEQIYDDNVAESIYDYKFVLTDDREIVPGKTYYKVSDRDNTLVPVQFPAEDPKNAKYYEFETAVPQSHDSLEPFALKFYLLKKSVSLNSKSAYNETFSMLNPYPDFYSLFSDTAHIEHTYGDILPLGKNFYKKSIDEEWKDNKSYWLWNPDEETYDLITDISEFEEGTPASEDNVYEIKVEALMPHVVFFKAFYPVVLNIATFTVLDSDTQDIVTANIIQALYKQTSSSDIEFGDEVSLEWLAKIAKEADTRIKAVTVEPLSYSLYATYYDDEAKAYKEIKVDDDMSTFNPESYQSNEDIVEAQIKKDIMAKSILAGTSQLLVPDTEFMYHLPQRFIDFIDGISNIESEAHIDIATDGSTSYSVDNNTTYMRKSYELKPNETITLFRPAFVDDPGEFLNGIHFEYVLKDVINADATYRLGAGEYFILYKPIKDESDNTVVGYEAHCCGEGSIVNSTFKILPNTSTSTLTNFARSYVLPYFESLNVEKAENASYYKTETYNNTYMTEIRNNSSIINNAISGTDAIRLQQVQTVTLTTDDKYKYFWILNEPTYSSNDNLKSYVLFDRFDSEEQGEYSETINTYTLKANEALLYTNEDMSEIESLGAGTTLIRNCGVDRSEYTRIENTIYFAYTNKLSTIVENGEFQELTTETDLGRPRESGWYELESAVSFTKIKTAKNYREDEDYYINDVVIHDDSYWFCMENCSGEWDEDKWFPIHINLRTTASDIQELIGSTINPYALGFYEHVSTSEEDYYVPSTDKEEKEGKEYYVATFKRSFDVTAITGKAYYLMIMRKQEGYYYRVVKVDSDGITRISYVSDTLDTDCFEKINLADYENPTLVDPVEEGYYKIMSYNESPYIDKYSLSDAYEASYHYRFANAADILTGNNNNRGNEYYEHDSSIIDRKILADTSYSSIDISNIATYKDIDLSSGDTFNPSTLKLLEPTVYRAYYKQEGDRFVEVETDYLTNPYMEELWVKEIIEEANEEQGIEEVAEYHSCHDEEDYICFTPEILEVELTDSAALFTEYESLFTSDIGGKGFYYKANSNGTTYRVKGEVNAEPWLSAVTPVDSSIAPLKSLYSLYVTVSATSEYDPSSPKQWLEWVEDNWTDTSTFQRPYYRTPTAFSPTTMYSYNDLVSYESVPYRCRVSVSGPGEWNEKDWYRIDTCWKTYKFNEDDTRTLSQLSNTELANTYFRVKSSVIMDRQTNIGPIYPCYEVEDDLVDPTFYAKASYYRTLVGEAGDDLHPYIRGDMIVDFDTDLKLILTFPNKKYDINDYATVQLYYLPKLYKFNDYVRFTDTDYYVLKDFHSRHCDVIDAWSCTALDADDLAENQKKAIGNLWATLQTNTSLTIIKNEVETLSAGDRLIFSTNEDSVVWPSFSNDETRLDLESYDVAYQKSGGDLKYLDYIDVDTYTWKGYSSLIVKASSTEGQKLEENHVIRLYDTDDAQLPIWTIFGEAGVNKTVQFRNSVDNPMGNYVSVVTKNTITGDSEENAVYVYEPYPDGNYYKYDTASNKTSLLFNSVKVDPDDPESEMMPQQITVPFGLPGGQYLIGCCMMDDVHLTVVNNNMLNVDGILFNLDAPVVNYGDDYGFKTDYVNNLHSYMNEKRTVFEGDKYDYIYMNTGEGQFRKLTAPSLMCLTTSPAEQEWYDFNTETGRYELTTNENVGAGLLIEEISESDDGRNPKELGWYEKTSSSYKLTNDTSMTPNKSYYREPELYVSLVKVDSELVFTIDKADVPVTYTLDDIYKFEPNQEIGTFDVVREKVQALDVDEEYDYTFVPIDNDLIKYPLKAKEFFKVNHIFNKNIIAQLDFDNIDFRFTTIR